MKYNPECTHLAAIEAYHALKMGNKQEALLAYSKVLLYLDDAARDLGIQTESFEELVTTLRRASIEACKGTEK